MLPKKEAPGKTVDSAERVNAGVLFDQEQTAASAGLARTSDDEGAKTVTAAVPPAPPTPKPEQPLVKPLQTFQGDIASLVDEKNISVVSIASAEAERRGTQPLQSDQAPLNQEARSAWLRKAAFMAGGVMLIAGALGIGAYIFIRMQPVPISEQFPAPFMLVDETRTIQVAPGDTRASLMQTLDTARKEMALSLGLVARLQVVQPTAAGDGLQEIGAPEFLQMLAPQIPAQLVRTLEPQMLLGVHSFDENQAFMILKADSYETAYSGMLAWEGSMRGDLTPLFTRTPAVRALPVPPAPIQPVGTTTASSTSAATTTAALATSTSTINPNDLATGYQIFQGNFLDQVVENHDARVVINQNDDILLLWTFLDRSTIVVTTNAQTLKEVISRISHSSTVSLPPQN